MLINKVSKFIKDKKRNGQNIKVLRGGSSFDDAVFAPMPEVPKFNKSKIIEGTELECKKVPINSENSGFSYFLDGIERKRVLFNYNFMPVTYGYVAAVIMKRTDKKMHSINFENKQENLYLPYREFEDSPANYFNLDEFAEYGFTPKNTGTKDKDTGTYPQFPAEFERRAHSNIQETRGKLERELALKWVRSGFNDGWLFIDGRLENKNNELLNSTNIVGIIKSHHVYYFDHIEQNKIYTLKKGERTSVFQPVDSSDSEENVFTWYLRLHEDNSGGKIDFGIIRVEIPANRALLGKVDEISSWILLETKPVALPESRWDRMIYPIKYCEDYLKSKAPSWAMIESLA